MKENLNNIPSQERYSSQLSRRRFLKTAGAVIPMALTTVACSSGLDIPTRTSGNTSPTPTTEALTPTPRIAIDPNDYRGSNSDVIMEPTPTQELILEQTVEPTPKPTEEPTQEPTQMTINPEDYRGSGYETVEETTPAAEPTDEPTQTPEPTPTQEPTMEPTPTQEPTAEPTDEPTQEPTVEPTSIPETTSSLLERYEQAGADFEKMDALVEISKQVVASMDETQYEYGWCLKGVQDAFMQVGLQVINENPDGTMMRDENGTPLRPGSAYQMIYLLGKDPRFTQIEAEREEFADLLPGTVIVWDKDPSNGDAGAQQHGHIEICWENGVRASSYVNDGSEIPFFELNSDFAVFAPKVSHLGTEAPSYLSSIEEYKNEINKNFELTMEGFDKNHLAWAWEKLWEVSKTKFDRLIAGTKFHAVDGKTSRQIDIENINLGRDIEQENFGPISNHESGHIIYNRYLDKIFPRIKEAYEIEGPVSTYGEVGYKKYPNDEVRRFHEDFADTVMYFLNPLYTTSSQNLVDDHPNYLYDPKDPKPLHRQLAEDILMGNLILED